MCAICKQHSCTGTFSNGFLRALPETSPANQHSYFTIFEEYVGYFVIKGGWYVVSFLTFSGKIQNASQEILVET